MSPYRDETDLFQFTLPFKFILLTVPSGGLKRSLIGRYQNLSPLLILSSQFPSQVINSRGIEAFLRENSSSNNSVLFDCEFFNLSRSMKNDV